MTAPAPRSPFWTTPTRPTTSADPAALATLARLLDGAPEPSALPSFPRHTLPEVAGAGPVRADGRIVGIILPFAADGEGPIYTPVRGHARLRELIDEGIIV